MAFHPLDNRSCREREQVDVCPPLPPRRHDDRHGNQCSDIRASSAYANAMIPSGHPPPCYAPCDVPYSTYNAYYPKLYDDRQMDWTTNHAQQPVYHQQRYLPVPHDYKPSRAVSPRPSSVDISRKTHQSSYMKERDIEGSANLLGRPIPSVFIDCPVVRSMNQSAALCDRVAVRVNDVLSRLDSEDYSYHDIVDKVKDVSLKETKNNEDQSRSIVDFRKTWLYANSRLRPGLLPMRLYLPTWQLTCVAAEASLDVYRRPRKGEKEDYVEADWRQGTKSMVVNSRSMDEQNLIVIAIRGSKWHLVDWAVNFRPAPSEPIGFLDDSGNACHAGFLQVARAMVAPIAARLRHLLEQDPSRASSSLLLTGHSAGGAVASLLYMHMISVTLESELNILTGCFKRIHCVTFGAPPLTFLPLQHPARSKNIFLAFANEGDCVVRANKQYISTLVKIIAAPSPLASSSGGQGKRGLRQRISRTALSSGDSPGSRHIATRWVLLTCLWCIVATPLKLTS